MVLDHLGLIRRALELAAPQHPHPNPRVGAIVVSDTGEVLGEGAHASAGEPHAEPVALAEAGERARGSTLAVSLEPCVHEGRTPPCTEAIIDAGIGRVIYGATDPDPRVAGAGAERLRAAGLEVVGPVAQDEVEAADAGYFHHRRTGRPLLTQKVAITLDGQTAAADGTSQWITAETARRDAHRLRAAADAVMVGAGTLRADDPSLTVRLERWTGPQPVPVIVAGHRPLPAHAVIWDREPIVLGPSGTEIPAGTLVEVPPTDAGIDVVAGVGMLGSLGLLEVLVEGGAGLFASLWAAGLVDRGVIYVGALMAGGAGVPVFSRPWTTMAEATPLEIVGTTNLGGDLRIDWRRS